MLWWISLVFSIIMTFGSLLGYFLDKKTEYFVIILIFCLLDILCFKKFMDKISGRTAQNKDNARRNHDLRRRTLLAKHQAGLPIAQDSDSVIVMERDFFRIKGGGNEFCLSKNKITDMCLKTDFEIERQYVSSAGGAVAGAIVFGALGAIVGGRVKEKKKRINTYYLIFTYRSEDEINYISFEISQSDYVGKAWKWSRELRNQIAENSQNQIVEL